MSIEIQNANGNWEKLARNDGCIMYNKKKQYAQDIRIGEMGDKEIWLELMNTGKNKLWWRNKFIAYLPKEVVDMIRQPVDEYQQMKLYKHISQKFIFDAIMDTGKYVDEKETIGEYITTGVYKWSDKKRNYLHNSQLKYRRRKLTSWSNPRCCGINGKGKRCNLGGTIEKSVPQEWYGNITNIVKNNGREVKHFCKYHEKQYEDPNIHYWQLNYRLKDGYCIKIGDLPEHC